jgi:hypothetical protein
MTKQSIIERTVKIINSLPDSKAEEISDFADFVIKRYEDQRLLEDLQQVITNSQAFEFLHDEEDMYTEEDIKEKYNG